MFLEEVKVSREDKEDCTKTPGFLRAIFQPPLGPPDLSVFAIERLITAQNRGVDPYSSLSLQSIIKSVFLKRGRNLTPAGKNFPSNSTPPSGTTLTSGIPTAACNLILS
jgi:hypothetical protein